MAVNFILWFGFTLSIGRDVNASFKPSFDETVYFFGFKICLLSLDFSFLGLSNSSSENSKRSNWLSLTSATVYSLAAAGAMTTPVLAVTCADVVAVEVAAVSAEAHLGLPNCFNSKTSILGW